MPTILYFSFIILFRADINWFLIYIVKRRHYKVIIEIKSRRGRYHELSYKEYCLDFFLLADFNLNSRDVYCYLQHLLSVRVPELIKLTLYFLFWFLVEKYHPVMESVKLVMYKFCVFYLVYIRNNNLFIQNQPRYFSKLKL